MKNFFKKLGLWTLVALVALTPFSAAKNAVLTGEKWIGLGAALLRPFQALLELFIAIGVLALDLLIIIFS